jgi:hypothetical protein
MSVEIDDGVLFDGLTPNERELVTLILQPKFNEFVQGLGN